MSKVSAVTDAIDVHKLKQMLRYMSEAKTQAGKAILPAPRLADNTALVISNQILCLRHRSLIMGDRQGICSRLKLNEITLSYYHVGRSFNANAQNSTCACTPTPAGCILKSPELPVLQLVLADKGPLIN